MLRIETLNLMEYKTEIKDIISAINEINNIKKRESKSVNVLNKKLRNINSQIVENKSKILILNNEIK